MLRRLLTTSILVASVFGTSAAFAQSEEDIQEAQQHFAKGAEWFATGEYAKAVVEFTSGHALAPNAMFLYNVSLCYERLENIDSALGAARKATQFEGMPPEVEVRNAARIVAFSTVLRSQDLSKTMAARAEQQATEQPDTPATSETVTRPDGITTLGWVGLGLAAVGTGFVVGGVATNSAIVQEIDTYEAAAAAGDSSAYDDSRETIEKKQGQGKLFYGVGFGALGLGAALFIVDLVTGTEEVPVATVIPLSDGAMINAQIHF